jgi:hypothetical protein
VRRPRPHRRAHGVESVGEVAAGWPKIRCIDGDEILDRAPEVSTATQGHIDGVPTSSAEVWIRRSTSVIACLAPFGRARSAIY